MELTIVGWRTKRLLLDAFDKLDMPSGLRWYPGNEVDSEEDLSFTLDLIAPDPMLVFVRAEQEDLEALGAWLTGRASELHRVETAVICDDSNVRPRSVEAAVTWPKWPLAWVPLGEDSLQLRVRLDYIVRRTAAVERAGASRASEAAAHAGRW